MRAVRAMWDGPLALAGGDLRWHSTLGGRSTGTRPRADGNPLHRDFGEPLPSTSFKSMVVDSDIDDIALTRGISGLDANFLRPSLLACGLDPDEMAKSVSAERAKELFSFYAAEMRGPKRWVDLWSAGHTVSAVDGVQSVADLVDTIFDEYLGETDTRALLSSAAGAVRVTGRAAKSRAQVGARRLSRRVIVRSARRSGRGVVDGAFDPMLTRTQPVSELSP